MTKLCVIVLSIGLAACANKKRDEEGKEPLSPPPAAATSTAPATPPAAAGGTAAPAAAPAAAETGSTPAAVSGGGATTPAPVACATATTLRCDAGQVDGCTGGLTSVHLCVASDAKAGSPCAQGAALTCPTGQVDACTYTPPYASTHVCVAVPKPAP